MFQRVYTAHLLLVAALSVTLVPASFAQVTPDSAAPASTPEIESSRYSFVGEVNADGALIRSGPSESDYAVLKLAKGARLTVVGMRFDWLKVEPPEGSYCLVSQAFVDKRGDGSIGRITGQKTTVRIGSTLSQQKHKVPMQLEPNAEVKIIGEDVEFYKIEPPAGVYMYIDKRFVNPVRRADAEGILTPDNVPTPPTATTDAGPRGTVQPEPGTSTSLPPGVAEAETSPTDPNKFEVKSDLPVEAAKSVEEAQKVAESIRQLQERLSKLEDRYAAAGQQELAQQPIDDLLKDYNDLIADQQLPPNARKVAEFRAQQLTFRKEALAQFLASKQAQEVAAQQQRDLKAEEEELQQVVAQTQVKRFAAVGRLVPSSLQVGNQTLYRLVDPANSRLVIYVRTAQVPVAEGLNQFVGITGQVVNDQAMHLTYVQPEAFEVVDPKEVNKRIFADHTPPSMVATNVAGEAPNE